MNTETVNDFVSLYPFMTSLGLGLIMGLERERRPVAKAGLRTFALTAVMGTACALLAQRSGALWLLPAAWLSVALLMIAADRQGESARQESDTTSTVALLLCFAYGAMLWYGYTVLTVALSLATTALLYFKAELHAMAHISRQEMVSLLQFATISFVILPVLPDRGYGPYEALNPYRIWLMVVLMAGISLAGYVALRLVGARRMPVLLGLLGGMVSSTATTLVFSRKVRGQTQLVPTANLVILTANLVLLLRVSTVTAVVAPRVLPVLLPVMALGFIAGALPPLYLLRRGKGDADGGDLLIMRNPLEMAAALSFGLIFAIALMLTAWLHDLAGAGGVYAVALVLGLTDVDAATLAALRLYTAGEMMAVQAITALALAVIANMGFKAAIALVIGGRALAWRVLLGYLPMLAGLLTGLALMRQWYL